MTPSTVLRAATSRCRHRRRPECRAARLGAKIGANSRSGFRSGSRRNLRSSMSASRQLHLPQFRIAIGDDGALAGGVDHDGGYRRHQARHVHEMGGVDAFLRQLIVDVRGWCFRRGRPSGRQARRGRRAGRCRSPPLSALPPQISSKWSRVFCRARQSCTRTSGRAPACRCRDRGGSSRPIECSLDHRTGMPIAEDMAVHRQVMSVPAMR